MGKHKGKCISIGKDLDAVYSVPTDTPKVLTTDDKKKLLKDLGIKEKK